MPEGGLSYLAMTREQEEDGGQNHVPVAIEVTQRRWIVAPSAPRAVEVEAPALGAREVEGHAGGGTGVDRDGDAAVPARGHVVLQHWGGSNREIARRGQHCSEERGRGGYKEEGPRRLRLFALVNKPGVFPFS